MNGLPDKQSNEQQDGLMHNVLALTATWLSALLILAVLAFLVYEALGPTESPVFEVRLGEVRGDMGRYYLPLTVTNRGGQSVQGLELRVVLLDAGAQVAEAGVTLEFLPSRSSRQATVVFERDPADFAVRVDIVGYADP